MWYVFLLRFILASTYIVTKESFSVVKPLFFVGTYISLSGAILLWWCWMKNSYAAIKKEDWTFFFKASLYQIYAPLSMDFYAAQYVSANTWSLIHAACPIVTALLSWFILKESLTTRKYAGLIVGVIGISFIFMIQQPSLLIDSAHYYIFAECMLALSMVIYSYSWIMIKQIALHYSPFFINGINMVISGILALCSSALFEHWHTTFPVYCFGSYFFLLIISVITNIVAFPLYAYLLRQYSATFLSFSSFLEPLLVSLFSWLLFAEIVSIYFYIALCMLMAGLYIFHQEELLVEPMNTREL